MNRTEKRRKIKLFAKVNKVSIQEAKEHFETLSDNEINNIKLTESNRTTLDVFLNSAHMQEVIAKAMEPDANPIMTINDIGEVAGWFNLPKYQQDANEAWVTNVYNSLNEGSVWYFEFGDTLFVKKGHGFACIGGGLKEMGIAA